MGYYREDIKEVHLYISICLYVVMYGASRRPCTEDEARAEMLNLLKALSDETRLKIVELLLDGERCACELIPLVDRSQPTVSIQLSKLKSLGVVECRKEGKSVYYWISDPRVRKVIAALKGEDVGVPGDDEDVG